MKISFKPFQIYSAEAAADPKLKAYSIANRIAGLNGGNDTTGLVWIDPESDYDTKIIRVDPTTKIGYKEAQDASEVKSSIKSFIKNKATFNISNGELFDIDITNAFAKNSIYSEQTSVKLNNVKIKDNNGTTVLTNKLLVDK